MVKDIFTEDMNIISPVFIIAIAGRVRNKAVYLPNNTRKGKLLQNAKINPIFTSTSIPACNPKLPANWPLLCSPIYSGSRR
jgi:hypothetical protein